MTDRTFEWITLDNAGKVFPGQNTDRWSNVYRLTFKLREEVDPDVLRQALTKTFERLPTFRVHMRRGFFWNYYERNPLECPVNHDISNFCYRINYRENNGYLIRVYYHGSRISVDIYHALCDAYGGMVFISTLVGEYLRIKGHNIPHNSIVLDVTQEMRKEEYEDAYIRYATGDTKANLTDSVAYHKKGTRLPKYTTDFTSVEMSFNQLHSVSKSYGVTVTEFLAAVLLDIHYRKQKEQCRRQKDVSVQIPVNLRKFFPTESLRNFVLCVTVKINPRKKDYTFEEIVSTVSEQLRRINNKKAHHSYITRTVKIGTDAIKLIPLAIKNTVVRVGFAFGAEYSTTVLLSNLGAVSLPEEMQQLVEKTEFYEGGGLVNPARCSGLSVGDRFVITFSNLHREKDIEREFLERLISFGIGVTVETNRDGAYSDIEGVKEGDSDAYSKDIYIPSKQDRIKLKKPDISFSEKMKRVFHLG